MRLFFAIELPDRVRAALGRLRGTDPSPDYRWADPASLHITLAFLGERPVSDLAMLDQIGRAAASASPTGTLRLGAAGSFGSRSTPRVLWVGLEGDLAALHALQTRLDSGLRQASFPVEERTYRPHITLARRRPMARGGPPPGWPPTHIDRAEVPVRQLILFESRLSPRGPAYTPVGMFPIGAG